MSDEESKEARRTAAAFLRRVDWPRVLNGAAVFLRELRGDDDKIDEDTQRIRQAGKKTKQAIEQAGRTASGCGMPCKPPGRLCGFCQEAADVAAAAAKKEEPAP